MTKVLLISNRVMHYRVPVYNYFEQRFREHGATFIVRSSSMQKQNPHPPEFDFKAIPFSFDAYRAEIERLQPDVVILFIHLKELMVWPLVHWLKYQGIPVAFWSKAKNYDNPHNLVSRCLYRYMHALCDGLILYSDQELKHLTKRHRRKAFPANNTVNFEHYPQIDDTREDIKREFNIPYKRVVLSVGRMDVGGQRKKIDHLIEVFRNIKDDGIGLVIVGAGMSGEQLSKINPNNTMYLGEVYDPQEVQISKLFKMADVFSIPGHAGLGLNQAFFWGLPVVTEDGRHPPEINYLVDGRNGFMVPSNDLDALKEKLLYLLENDAERLKFSECARADILRHASVSNMFAGFKSCVDRLVSGRQPSAALVANRRQSPSDHR